MVIGPVKLRHPSGVQFRRRGGFRCCVARTCTRGGCGGRCRAVGGQTFAAVVLVVVAAAVVSD